MRVMNNWPKIPFLRMLEYCFMASLAFPLGFAAAFAVYWVIGFIASFIGAAVFGVDLPGMLGF